ncbi:vascular cell adhesion protein 1-like [Cottoperca gobio]|uniref:Vascular cell adhesion protein 1-like n=1 Tax=Cottoperca gobio TaxID=56716 RepID=A0A6J2RXE3_COTGO|nr:vascular cell adhesion protein 1-like [Cottoperca gobio]
MTRDHNVKSVCFQTPDSPPSPTIEISGDVKENVSVTINCSAATPCPHDPPQLTWTLQQNPDNIIKENADRTFTTEIQKTFILSDQHDGLNITCSASYPVNEGTDHKTAEETKTLNVSYAPKNTSTSISPSSGWAADSRVNLSCSSTANPPVSSFTWFKKSNDGAVRVSEGRCYSFNVTGGGVYYCVATNGLGNQTSSDIQLTIEEPSYTSSRDLLAVIIIAIIVLISLLVCVCTLVCWRWFKSTRSTQQPTQSQTAEELAVKEPAPKTEEDIHYGEIDFSKRRPEQPSEQDGALQQETLYAQVKVPETANRSTPTDDEALYAQVKRK